MLGALAAVLVRAVTGEPGLGWYLASWALFCAALWLTRKRADPRLIIGGGIILASIGLLAPPSTSTDSFRYAWDGRVQAAGISPYDHAPAARELVPLRDAWLFPGECAEDDLWPLPEGGCTRINRPTVPTIYPPVAQGYFLLVEWLSPDGSRHKALQLGGWAMAVAVLLLLARRDLRASACWAWCPAVPVEAVNNAHVDMLAVLLVVLALSVRRGRGALLGAAVAVKLLPAAVLPGAMGRTKVLTVLAPAVLVMTAAYLPYVLLSDASVIGYLPGYLSEESYRDPGGGNRYALLRWVLPDSWAPFAAAGLLILIAAYVVLRGDPERPWQGALLVSGSMLLLFTPGYSWYALLVVALAAMDGRWEWLGVALAGAVAYIAGPVSPTSPATVFYAAAALAVLIGWAARRQQRIGAIR